MFSSLEAVNMAHVIPSRTGRIYVIKRHSFHYARGKVFTEVLLRHDYILRRIFISRYPFISIINLVFYVSSCPLNNS